MCLVSIQVEVIERTSKLYKVNKANKFIVYKFCVFSAIGLFKKSLKSLKAVWLEQVSQ